VLRWATDATQRTFELQSATVDGIDAPGPLDLERIVTQPELAVVPRAGMATAYLAFGNEDAFDDARVRRAIAASLDRAVLAAEVFPSGSVTATHTVPCGVPGGCAGILAEPTPWLRRTGRGRPISGSYTIHVPTAVAAAN
jgi:ABC-type transport system substrate-binding protein